MKRTVWMLVFATSPFWVGCGGSSSGGNAPPAGKTTSTNQVPSAGPQLSPAAEIVAQFLDSVRRGDEVTSVKLLTTVAIEELKKSGVELSPPGSPEATFVIGRTEYMDDDKDAAYVQLHWTEPDPNGGESQKIEAVFCLRLEEAGWRIASMVVEETAGTEPIVVDFESLSSQPQLAEAQQGTAPGAQGQPPANNQAGNQLGNNLAAPNQLQPPATNAPQNQLRPSTNTGNNQPTQMAQPNGNNIKR